MTAVVFDLGNVLYRWAPEVVFLPFFETHAAMNAALDQIGFADWNREQDRGRDWDDAVTLGAAAHPEYAHLFAAYRNGLAAAHREPINSSIETLRSLHRSGVPVYAITNASLETIAVLREMYDSLDLFRDIVVSAAEGVLKPGPEIFQRFLNRNDLTADRCIFIDDTEENVLGARAIGMRAIHFTTPETLRHTLKREGLPL